MSYSSILICLDSLECVEGQVATAARLSLGSTSHITGVHVMPAAELIATSGPHLPIATLSGLENHYKHSASKIQQAFETAMKGLDQSFTWEWCQRSGVQYLDHAPYVEHALLSDVVVTSQPHEHGENSGIAHTLLHHSGTPVVVVPRAETPKQLGQHICIGWNETIESARAVRDAMPLLRQAESVEVIWIGRVANTAKVHGVDVARYLSRHGISAEVKNLESGLDRPGESLLQYAQDRECDLLVMGGFGHSAVYNLIFGAATPHVLKEMTAPLFLSR